MPHFVVSECNGRENYAVEFAFTDRNGEGSKRNGIKHSIEIPYCVAALPLDTLIQMYRDGIRPRKKLPAQTLELPQPKHNPLLAMG